MGLSINMCKGLSAVPGAHGCSVSLCPRQNFLSGTQPASVRPAKRRGEEAGPQLCPEGWTGHSKQGKPCKKVRAEKMSLDVGIGRLRVWEQMGRPRVLTWSWPHFLGPALCPSLWLEDKGSALQQIRLVDRQARKQDRCKPERPSAVSEGVTHLSGVGLGRLPGGGAESGVTGREVWG